MSELHGNTRRIAGDDEIDLRDLLRMIWAGKWIIGVVTLVGAIVGVAIALMLPNIYRAEALLAPNQDQSAGGLSALAAQYGGLASLAGINLSQGGIDQTALGLEVLKSRKFISGFINRRDILVPLMAADGWNAATDTLVLDDSVYDADTGNWLTEAKPPRSSEPSDQEAFRKFRSDILSVSHNRQTGFVTVAVNHYSPIIAKQWVDWLVQDLNATVMQQDVSEALQAIDYLEAQIASTSIADLQNVFFRLIEDQTRTVMLARVSPEYLFKTIDPAVVPERRSKPNRMLIAVVSVLLAGALGTLLVLARGNTALRRV